MWLSAKSQDVYVTTEHNAAMYTEIFYINMNFNEQNMHVLCNMKSFECHLMNIIKG